MKINNETKIGILAAVGIALLVFGFNFLKGKDLLKKEKHIYAKFEDIINLGKSGPVVINGLQVGTVSDLDGGKDMKIIVVTIRLTKDINIPSNSTAVINPNLLGTTSLEIKLGTSTTYIKPGDTLQTIQSGGALDEAMKAFNPVLYEVKNATHSLDSVLRIVGNVFDPNTKNDIRSIISNLRTVTGSFIVSADHMKVLLDPQNGSLAKTLENAHTFSNNLVANNAKINDLLANADKASAKFASLDLQSTLSKLDSAINEMKAGVAKINSNKGSLGLLLNDTKLYDNLAATSNKINILIDDIRVHPKRYVNISVFGKKDKGNYITSPLQDDTIKVPLKHK